MTLTSHTDFAAFLEAVQQCRGEVLFCTREGDKLNLKSTLSKYLFAALAGNEELLRKGKIVCQFPPYGLSSASALRIMQYCQKNGVCVFCLAFLPKKVELVYVNAIYFVFCAEAALYTVGYTIQKDGCFL